MIEPPPCWSGGGTSGVGTASGGTSRPTGTPSTESRASATRADVETVDVVADSVPGLAHDGQGPDLTVGSQLLHLEGDERVADDPDAVGVRDTDGRQEHPGLPDPLDARHLAIGPSAMEVAIVTFRASP